MPKIPRPPAPIIRSSLTGLAVLVLATMPEGLAGTDQPAPPAELPGGGGWLQDSVIRPTQPFELVPGKSAGDWTFVFEPYAWTPGLYGRIGIREFPVAQVNDSPVDVLRKLDWGIFARGEVRRGRWGLLGDGFFAQFTAGAESDALYRNISITSQQSMVSLALAYRVVDDRRYFVDFYAGGRYNYLGASVDASVNRSGVESLSRGLIERAATKFGPRLLAKYPGLKNVPASTLRQAKELGVRKLSDSIEDYLPTRAQQSRWWIDPIVGLRAQVNFSRWLFAAAQADAGGFGAGSQVTWNTQATLGVNFSRQVALEAGYRYMYIDYDKDNFLYNVNMPGIFAGVVFKF